MVMNKYYFTFGCHHRLSDYVQPIVAPNMRLAMSKMFKLHGKDWALDYTGEEYHRHIIEGTLPRKKELKVVIV